MSKVTKLRSAIVTILRAVHPRTYYQRAPDNAVYPYLVYELPNSADQGDTEQFVLDVDGWDRPAVQGDSTQLEQLMAAVDEALDRRVVTVDGTPMVIYRETRLPLEDDDVRLLRRKYVYQVRVFEKVRGYHNG